MGVYSDIKNKLPNQFSIFQLMEVLKTDAQDVRKVRNVLKQFYLDGNIKRLSKNMYQKINQGIFGYCYLKNIDQE